MPQPGAGTADMEGQHGHGQTKRDGFVVFLTSAGRFTDSAIWRGLPRESSPNSRSSVLRCSVTFCGQRRRRPVFCPAFCQELAGFLTMHSPVI
jgi:hypothetical protein